MFYGYAHLQYIVSIHALVRVRHKIEGYLHFWYQFQSTHS